MCYSKLSSLLNSPSHDVRASHERPTKSGCKDSANRAKMQIYLRFSEVQPIFKLQSRLELVQIELDFYFAFSEKPPNFKQLT